MIDILVLQKHLCLITRSPIVTGVVCFLNISNMSCHTDVLFMLMTIEEFNQFLFAPLVGTHEKIILGTKFDYEQQLTVCFTRT